MHANKAWIVDPMFSDSFQIRLPIVNITIQPTQAAVEEYILRMERFSGDAANQYH